MDKHFQDVYALWGADMILQIIKTQHHRLKLQHCRRSIGLERTLEYDDIWIKFQQEQHSIRTRVQAWVWSSVSMVIFLLAHHLMQQWYLFSSQFSWNKAETHASSSWRSNGLEYHDFRGHTIHIMPVLLCPASGTCLWLCCNPSGIRICRAVFLSRQQPEV